MPFPSHHGASIPTRSRLFVASLKKKSKWKQAVSSLIFSAPVLFIAGWVSRGIISLLIRTLRVTIHGKDHLLFFDKEINSHPKSATPVIIALWHNHLLLAPLLKQCALITSCKAIVSQSRDAALLAAFINTYKGASVIKVGHRSRHHALQEMINALMERDIILITPDGPRGPRHQAKEGALYAAQKSGAAIVPLSWKGSKVFELPTWDRLQIPYPFSKIELSIKAPITVPLGKDPKELTSLLNEALISNVRNKNIV